MKLLAVGMVLVSLVSPACAADGAKFRPLGFSKDARYFAFEQYGLQDGSGFAYDDVFVLDISTDEWVKGTPITVVLEEETMSVDAVRAKARQQSSTVLKSLAIDHDVEFLATNPFTEVVKDRSKLTFHDHYNNAMGMFGTADNQGSWDIVVSNVAVPLPDGCEDDIEVVGYKLEIKNNKTGAVKLLHQDKIIPKSRYCSVGYDVEAVVQPVGAPDGDGQLVVIIGVYRRGFEGADRRFIAVPFKFN